jgi:hypothetical protein
MGSNCSFDSCSSFHQVVKDSLERKRADVVELYQPMTESMKEIHGGLVQCMSMTLAELKRSNTTVGIFLSFTFPSIHIFPARSR